jgi:transposase-like protein
MAVDLTNPIFHNEDAARAHLESVRWPEGPVCVHCGSKRVTRMVGKSHRAGLIHCNDCEKPFTVTVDSVMERSKIPLAKWVLGFHLMAASKKGVSSHQLHRMLGITYKSAWFLSMRIREAMGLDAETAGPIGGGNKVVESDETYVGGKKKNVHNGKPEPKKHAVVTLVERDGTVRAKHVPNVTAANVKEHLFTNVDKASYLMTDESKVYITVGKKFAGHMSVNHSQDEYVRLGGFVHVNTAESFHALVKRGMYGTYHAVSEHHLQRYIDEAAFKWNNRVAAGIDDTMRATNAIKGAEGKRLMYRCPDSARRAV